jgi:cytochrome P450
VKHILQDSYHNYIRGRNVETARLLLGNGLAMVDGDSWLQRRRLMQPAFHRRRLEALVETMVETIEEVIARWQPLAAAGQPLDLAAEMMELTLTVIVKTMFSLDDEATIKRLADAFNVAQAFIYRRAYSLWAPPLWLPTPNNGRFHTALATLDSIIYGLITQRRQNPAAHTDLLTMLLEAQDAETGLGMSDVELRDEIMTLFFAGHETTATALAWTLHVLQTNEAVRGCFEEEIGRVCNGRSPTPADLTQLTYTDRLLQESMRLYTPIWIFAREPLADDNIDGYHIPAGTSILISPYVTHHDPAIWPDPDTFDPDRFLPEQVSQRHRFAYYPFGGGPHLCIGQTFAMMEAKIALATIFQTYQLSPVPNDATATKPEVTLRPKHGILTTLQPNL